MKNRIMTSVPIDYSMSCRVTVSIGVLVLLVGMYRNLKISVVGREWYVQQLIHPTTMPRALRNFQIVFYAG